MSKNYVILANGDFPGSANTLELLKQADYVAACDGAAGSLLNFGRIPDVVVGDLDSLPAAVRDRLGDRVTRLAEQETNDLAKAFRTLLELLTPEDQLTILGAAGKREDHTLGNISLLADFAIRHEKIRMVTETGIFLPVVRETVFSARPGQAVSFFNPTGQMVRLSGSGLRYPLERLELRRWWTATLNTVEGDHFTLIPEPGTPVLLLYLAN